MNIDVQGEPDGRFPIQTGLTVSMDAARRAYESYARFYGNGQSLVRLADRGGFGMLEFVDLYLGGNGSHGLRRPRQKPQPAPPQPGEEPKP